ncbi:MAG TPA: hypothetical protein VIY47_14935 [Ignavibacteriaceae bacterium]
MLKHVEGKVIVSMDIQKKNYHTFSDGTIIRRERQYNELNRRISEPVNAIVISGENIPAGVEILIHPNAASETNQIHNYTKLSGAELDSDIKYYSIPEEQCFIWKDSNNEWQPLPPYETALRVFKPHTGLLQNIEPTQLKDTLYVTSGDLKGNVVATLQACDYQIVFQDVNGREGDLIRFRPYGDDKHDREPEAIALLHSETKKVNEGKLLVGLTPSDAKKIDNPITKSYIPKDFQLDYKSTTIL